MGVVIFPVLFWCVLLADDPNLRSHRTFSLCLAAHLLYSSVSRAGILASMLAVALACVLLRRGKLLAKGAFVLVLMCAMIAVVQPGRFDDLVSSFTEDLVYKGKVEQGLFGCRKSPWQTSIGVIQESPWFGSGFGTDLSQDGPFAAPSAFRTMAGASFEHGNSYLALLQYVGVLGIVPFLILLFLILRLTYRVGCCMWRTEDPRHYAVPLALVCLAGLI